MTPPAPIGDARGPHAFDPDAPFEPLRPGDLGSSMPSAGDFAALARDVRSLMVTWRDSIMPMLLKQDAAAEAMRKELSGTLSQVHNLGREIDALRKTDADLATAHDAQRHMVTERVSRVELAIVGIHEILTVLRQEVAMLAVDRKPAARKPAARSAREPAARKSATRRRAA